MSKEENKLIKEPIRFYELKEFNDSNSVVFVNVTFTGKETLEDLSEFFEEIKLTDGDKKVTGIHYIYDNVLGDDGRSDYLIEFSQSKVPFNAMARLRNADSIKWTSDFIVNYKRDYESGDLV